MAHISVSGQVASDMRIFPFTHEERFFFEFHDRRSGEIKLIGAGDCYKTLEREVLRIIRKRKPKDLALQKNPDWEEVGRGREALDDHSFYCLRTALKPLFKN